MCKLGKSYFMWPAVEIAVNDYKLVTMTLKQEDCILFIVWRPNYTCFVCLVLYVNRNCNSKNTLSQEMQTFGGVLMPLIFSFFWSYSQFILCQISTACFLFLHKGTFKFNNLKSVFCLHVNSLYICLAVYWCQNQTFLNKRISDCTYSCLPGLYLNYMKSNSTKTEWLKRILLHMDWRSNIFQKQV